MKKKEIKAGDFVEIVTTEGESVKGYLQPTIIEGAFCVRLSTGGLEFVENELVDDIKESDPFALPEDGMVKEDEA